LPFVGAMRLDVISCPVLDQVPFEVVAPRTKIHSVHAAARPVDLPNRLLRFLPHPCLRVIQEGLHM
jgi:hypothetical protein